MVEVRKKEHETTTAMLRRFTRKIQQSGILLSARKKRFYRPKPAKLAKRLSALRRFKIFKERERLDKLGKLDKEKK